MLRKTGADTIRVGLNKGDEIFWGPDNFIAFTQDLTQWPDTFSNIVTKHTIRDVVLYGDTRPIHKPSAANRTLSKLQGLLATAAPFWR
jgi:capsular polysaccharide export protein